MTAQQKFCEKMFCEEEPSDHQLSILLVDIMNALGYSKIEREIHRHDIYLRNAIPNILRSTSKYIPTMMGSIKEGLHGGIFSGPVHHDVDLLFTIRNIKLYFSLISNINNPPPLHDNDDYDASFFVEECEDFPGYVKLSLAKMKANCVYLHCTIMNDDKLYLSNSKIMEYVRRPLPKGRQDSLKAHQISELHEMRAINGPAHTAYSGNNQKVMAKIDFVHCIHHDLWPNLAYSFITRGKPNNWPSSRMLKHIQSQGYDIAPVGHHDSKNIDIQWRISFPGEHSLLSDLTDVQILCYALIKIILRENLNTSQREVVSSFQIKHVMFWCVERCSCQWICSNYINCLNICLTKLIEGIKARHIPHYIIESRNLFNSKLTEQISKEVVDILSKYDTTHVFRLDAFNQIFVKTQYEKALLKNTALQSTMMACFNVYIGNFLYVLHTPSLLWGSYIPHNATESLLNYLNILQNLRKLKGVSIQYVKYLVKSMVGFLYYTKYKESNNTKFLVASKRLIQTSLNLDNSCVKLRAATFFLTDQQYSQSIKICNTFIKCAPTKEFFIVYLVHLWLKEGKQLLKEKTTEEIENIIKSILPMFYSSINLKSMPENYDTTQQNPVSIFRNFTNIFFHDLYTNVTFMTAEKRVVPDPILYEILSLSQSGICLSSGIHLDPMFVCFQIKFVCHHSMGNVADMDIMLTKMNSFMEKMERETVPTQSRFLYLNMLAYSRIKAGRPRKSVKPLLQSLRIYPSRNNAASGYLKIVLQILNSLSI